MDIIILEVDGSLANPFALSAVVVWTTCLTALMIWLVRNRATTAFGSVIVGLLFVLAAWLTRPAQLVIGNLEYWIMDQSISDVGFWGGPPNWIAPLVAGCTGLAFWIAARRGANRLASNALRALQLLVGIALVAAGIFFTALTIYEFVDPAGAKLADDGDPFGSTSWTDFVIPFAFGLALLVSGTILVRCRLR